MATLIAAKDWSRSPLGAIETWPQSLKIALQIMLDSRYAMWMGWGADLTFFCNDAYRPTLGVKQSWALGAPSREVWAEIWSDIGPRIESVLRTGQATYDEDLLLFLERHGYPEETYHTFSYSPLPGETGAIGGHLCVVVEDTERFIAERRLRVVREVASKVAGARTAEALFAEIGDCLAANARDLPFMLIYLREADGQGARLVSNTGVPLGHAAAPSLIELGDAPTAWRIGEVLDAAAPRTLNDSKLFEGLPGVWDKPPREAVTMPIPQQGHATPAGVVVFGLSPYRPLDDAYRGFLDLLVTQITVGLANVRAYEDERRRADALAELDRAKTIFFSNVSHEFRTPLTLMLGPLEEVLSNPPPGQTADERGLIDTAHRNGLRLLKLVNSLLDFSRIEAGRMEPSYEAIDIVTMTKDLASVFRAATDKAGLTLEVDSSPISEPTFVDPAMWEKIVLNLVSNAFKYTLRGRIVVSLRREGDELALSVEDTGVGIAEHEIPHLFDRFHRVDGVEGRTNEGTGIGLALVQELAKLHGGSVSVSSVLGQGSTFTVRIPVGTVPALERAPARAPGSASAGAKAYVEEALRWLPGAVGPDSEPMETASAAGAAELGAPRERVLLADDNADMRDYVRRLLSDRYEVEAVADGEAALSSLRQRPANLLLTDVMMPRLDGFGLLRAVRADPALADMPVMLLSARAGEEASIEGVEAGADDYLIKPFSARELLARVGANLKMARVRREAEQSLRDHNAALEAQVAERTRALRKEMAERQKAEAALQQAQRLEAIGQFTGGIAHDFNNLLTVVVGQAEAIIAACEGDPRITRMASASLRAAERGAQLTSQLLAFARRQQLRPVVASVAPLIADVGDLIRRTVGEAIVVKAECDPAVWPCHLDPAQFESAILNLAINARDAMPDGGRLSIAAANVTVSAAEAKGLDLNPGDYVEVKVIDTGAGMTAEVQQHAFEPFFTTKDVGKGTGLGLAQIYGFAKQSGGTVTLDSALGAGTQVALYLPRAHEAVTSQPSRRSSDIARHGNGKTVLVVEDQPDVREVITASLDELGYRILTAADGVAARLVLREPETIDLLLTDVVMPNGVSGPELAREAMASRPNIKVVLVSGYLRDTDKGQLAGPGVSRLSKPFTMAELASTIATAMTGGPAGP